MCSFLAKAGRARDPRADANFIRQLRDSIIGNPSETTRARQQEAQDRSTGPGPHCPCTDLPAADCGAARSNADRADNNWRGAALPGCYSGQQQPGSSSPESTAQTQTTVRGRETCRSGPGAPRSRSVTAKRLAAFLWDNGGIEGAPMPRRWSPSFEDPYNLIRSGC